MHYIGKVVRDTVNYITNKPAKSVFLAGTAAAMPLVFVSDLTENENISYAAIATFGLASLIYLGNSRIHRYR